MPMHDLGGNTQDLAALGIPHPAEHGLPHSDTEDHIHRLATWWTIAGTATLVLDATTALSIAVLGDGTGWATDTGHLFGSLSLTIVGLGGAAMLTAALIERIQRPQRALIRRAMARTDCNADEIAANRAAIAVNNRLVSQLITMVDDETRTVTAMTAEVGKVPGYGQAFQDGYQYARQAAGLADLDQLGGPDISNRFDRKFDR